MAHAVTLEDARTAELRLRMSYEDYLAFIDESTHSEWVDGEVTIFMPPAIRHQDISAFLISVLRVFLSVTRLGSALAAPAEMRLRSGRSYREPDILVVLAEHRSRFSMQRLDGPADMVVELLSPESKARDQREKRREFEEAGITEYWIIDATESRTGVVGLALSELGVYEPIVADGHGRIHSRVLPGFWLDQTWFTSETLPEESTVLRLLLPASFGV